ncbi:MAG: TfoX/Sxy family protein [Alphaproteobacteria bacterium]|nr:TfoX/Sxy family protein [Alphaproteobacteria bacterium]NNF25427.1 hypothetical protein [Paracoccaceae bacterium]
MAYDEGLADLMRGDLLDEQGITERKMFGGIAFMLNGNMLCGVHKGGGMFRVGKERKAAAMLIDGASAAAFTGRPMASMVEASEDAIADDARRGALIALALTNARGLPPK